MHSALAGQLLCNCPEAAAQLNPYARLNHRQVQAASVRDAAGGATAAVAAHVQPRNVAAVVPFLLDGMAPACVWQTKVLSLSVKAPALPCGTAGTCSIWRAHTAMHAREVLSLCRKESGGRLCVSLFHQCLSVTGGGHASHVTLMMREEVRHAGGQVSHAGQQCALCRVTGPCTSCTSMGRCG